MVTQMESLKKRLEQERDRLRREISDLEGQIPDRSRGQSEGDTYGNHLADEASDTFEQEKMAALEAHLRGTLSSVEYALHKLETGAYGVCERCGRPITEARLEALPMATLCIDCKAREEKETQRR
ncbi:MAG: TraR/DksA family transcriptional regulator [Chloroflexi bacterium]|nr:TraR/DksA family transcriptional regulator [Chloroflexota bacterium]